MLKSNKRIDRQDTDQDQTCNLTDNSSCNKREQTMCHGQTFKRERKSNILDDDTAN